MAELKELKKRRTNIKASISRINTFLENFQFDPAEQAGLKIKLRNLLELAAKYDEVQSQIELEDDSASGDREQTENHLYAIEVKIQGYLEHAASSRERATISADEVKPPINSAMPLPPVKLPYFSGDILNWQHFITLFVDLVHSRHDLSNLQKLHYLHASLRDEALHVIRELPITNENYDIALGLLRDRYDNKFLISTHYVQQLLSIKKLDNESLSDLSGFVDKAASGVNALKALDLPVNVFELVFVQFISNKLDSATSKLWKETLSRNKLPSFKGLVQFLNSRRQLLENISIQFRDKAKTSVNKHDNPVKSDFRKFKPKTQSFHAGRSTPDRCLMCRANHMLHICSTFRELDVPSRRKFLIQNKCCLNCLRRGLSQRSFLSSLFTASSYFNTLA